MAYPVAVVRHSEDPALRGRWRLRCKAFWDDEEGLPGQDQFGDWLASRDENTEVVRADPIPACLDAEGSGLRGGVQVLYYEKVSA